MNPGLGAEREQKTDPGPCGWKTTENGPRTLWLEDNRKRTKDLVAGKQQKTDQGPCGWKAMILSTVQPRHNESCWGFCLAIVQSVCFKPRFLEVITKLEVSHLVVLTFPIPTSNAAWKSPVSTFFFRYWALIMAFRYPVCYMPWKISTLYFLCLSFCEDFRIKQAVWSAIFTIDVHDVLHAHSARGTFVF